MAQKAEQPAVNISVQELQTLMEGLARTIVSEQVAAQNRVSPERQLSIEQRKAHWRKVIDQTREIEQRAKNNCKHRRPEDGYSLFWKMQNVHPAGAMTLVCSRCRQVYQNFPGENYDMEKFNYWFVQPTGLNEGY